MEASFGLRQLLLLLLLLGPPCVRAGAQREAVVCAEAACYTAHWGRLSAAEAQEHCNQNGGNLATLKSEEEAQHVQRALALLRKPEASPATRISRFWIGLQREKGKCLDPSLPLKGFSWVGGGEDTSYTNWHKEVRSSCISKRCVSLLLDLSHSRLPKWSEGPCGTPSAPGSSIEGFVCKFSFKGMCRPLALGGPGRVNYTTPFQATSSSLEAVPFASVAKVACWDSDGDEIGQYYFICREKDLDVFDWGSSGPLCVSPKYGCNFNNGGCQQDCFEGGDGSFRCGCRPGFRLLDDLVTCASRNPCSSSPCRGAATCVPEPNGKNYTCHCPRGYQLDSTRQDCIDVDECQEHPCPQACVNTPGGFRCECWLGFEPVGPGEEACQDVDECAPGHSPCSQGCTNTDGSFHCSCEHGYILTGEDGTQCQDVNECAGPAGDLCNSSCINTQGSFRCDCQPGWELAADGISCTAGPGSLEPSTGPPQWEDRADGEDELMPSATASTPTRDAEGSSTVVPTMGKPPSFPPKAPTTCAPPKTLAPSGPPDVGMETGTHHLIAPTGHEESTGGDLTAKQSNDSTDGQKLLLFYILGTVVALLLLLALSLGLLVYRKRKAKREKKKPQSATDSYSWVPERAESRAAENQYSPTPGTDC